VNDLLVLCYHAVSPTWRMPYAVTPDALAAQVTALLGRGYRPATLSDAMRDPPSAPTLVVTFDDGLVSVREHALPRLRDLGVPATLFACTAWVGRGEPMPLGYDAWTGRAHGGERLSLGWDDLAALRAAGWEVGSHTRSHPRLTAIDDAELADELAGSRRQIESELGVPCPSLAYPHGVHDDRVVAAARDAGYRLACTAQGGVDAPDPLRIPRIVVLGSDGPLRLRVKASTTARRLRGSSGPWRLLAPVWGRLGGGHDASP
jgi:peptidoglycan/xylan/chitin deacetylase (PgdA/CDA1 family)